MQNIFATRSFIQWTGFLYSACLPLGYLLYCTFYSLDFTLVLYRFATRPFNGLDFCTVHISHKTIYWTGLLYVAHICHKAMYLTAFLYSTYL